MKRFNLFSILILTVATIFAQEARPVKNVIVMIPDGTSVGVYSAARWFKYFTQGDDRLHIDPYLTGTVTTFSSSAVIGGSAPTGSCYATGILQQTRNIAIHPEASDNDLFPVDTARTYQPATTILEASKLEKQKAVGLVVTCEFPHATPAGFSAHHYNRKNYEAIAPQIVYQNLDVMFGGGTGILTDDMKKHLNENGTILIQDDREALLKYNGKEKVWALFGGKALPYNIDRNPEKVPSLAEMTEKALQTLSGKSENGFFLMVEGSQVDWAAHANDPATIINEFLAFDEAVGKVMEFAEKDGNTAVVVMPDHGNSGFTIGSSRCPGYDKLSIEQLFATVSQYKLSANGLESILLNTESGKFKEVFKQYAGIEISDEELETLLASRNYKETDYMKKGTSNNLAHNIVNILTAHTCFGFTTGGHTGEEVLLASYHPQGDILKGHVKNTDVNAYLQKVTGLKNSLQEWSDQIFVKHGDVFKGLKYTIDKTNPNYPLLKIKNGRKTLEVKAFSSVASLNGKPFNIGSVVVYIDKKNTFYLPKDLIEKL